MEKVKRQILRLLMSEGHKSNAALARENGLSESATLERVRRLGKDGVIAGNGARLESGKWVAGSKPI